MEYFVLRVELYCEKHEYQSDTSQTSRLVSQEVQWLAEISNPIYIAKYMHFPYPFRVISRVH